MNRAPSEGLLRSHNAEFAKPLRAVKQEWGPDEVPPDSGQMGRIRLKMQDMGFGAGRGPLSGGLSV